MFKTNYKLNNKIRLLIASSLVMLSLFVFFEQSKAAIAFDSATSSAFTSVTVKTLNHTVSSTASNMGLVVFLRNNGTADSIVSVTYATTALTQAYKFQEGATVGNNAWVYVYYLANATSGTHQVRATASTTETLAMWSLSYSGVNINSMVNATSAIAFGVATTTPYIQTTSTVDNAWVISNFRSYAGGNVTAGLNFTPRTPIALDGGRAGDFGPQTPAGLVTQKVTVTSGDISAIAISISPFVESPAGGFNPYIRNPKGPKGAGVSRDPNR